MIKITNLTKRYAKGKVKAVDDLSITVDAGEVFGFLGPNGAGKSTTIKCMTGILPYEEGNINICGYDLKEHPIEAKKRIGFVADDHVLYESLTGEEYVNFVADIFDVDSDIRKERVEKYADLFDMTDKLTSKISSYSHGMKQKISIISSLVHDPDVWILDEPLTGLDPKSGYELKKIMAERAAEGKTVFFSSHVLDVVEKICSKVAILDKGKLVTVCDIKELQEKRSDLSLEQLFLTLTGVKE